MNLGAGEWIAATGERYRIGDGMARWRLKERRKEEHKGSVLALKWDGVMGWAGPHQLGADEQAATATSDQGGQEQYSDRHTHHGSSSASTTRPANFFGFTHKKPERGGACLGVYPIVQRSDAGKEGWRSSTPGSYIVRSALSPCSTPRYLAVGKPRSPPGTVHDYQAADRHHKARWAVASAALTWPLAVSLSVS